MLVPNAENPAAAVQVRAVAVPMAVVDAVQNPAVDVILVVAAADVA